MTEKKTMKIGIHWCRNSKKAIFILNATVSSSDTNSFDDDSSSSHFAFKYNLVDQLSFKLLEELKLLKLTRKFLEQSLQKVAW